MNIVTGDKAIQGLVNGIDIAVDAIRLTYGNGGTNAVVENVNYPYHEVANDAQTIIQAIELTDPVEKRGLGFLKELMDKANNSSGDGRKTTAILAQTIIREALKKEKTGNEIKKELDAYIDIIENKIFEKTKQIELDEVYAVAKVAGESERIGKLVQSVYKSIGKDGIVHIEASGTYTDDITLIEGVRFVDTGFLSPFMVHDELAVKENRKETRAVYENPTILVTKRKINHIKDINPLLETMLNRGQKDLVIFADDMDSNVASLLVELHKSKRMNILIIKAPILWRNYVYEDFAKITGATIVEDASGVNFKNLTLDHLGTCGKIIVDKEETVVIGIKDISDHIENLKLTNTNDDKLRLSWLTTKTAILKLGANSESELSYLRLKTSDAINSARLALKSGVVKGGGLCLKEIGEEIDNKILWRALIEPYYLIQENNGGLEVTDDIQDSALVVKNAVRNAISLATTILTCNIVVYLPPKEQKELKLPPH